MLGPRINPCVAPAPAELIDRLRRLATPLISDSMNRLSGARGLNRYNRSGVLAGTALTVKTRPGDNLYLYKALTMMAPGHVLVIDGQGETSNALLGELIKLYALERGCVGFVVDGAIRDVESFAETPCYARGVSHQGPYKTGPGEINVPVSVGGLLVEPGDLVLGDADGVAAVPRSCALDVIESAESAATREEAIKAEIASGAIEQSWLNAVLSKGGLLP